MIRVLAALLAGLILVFAAAPSEAQTPPPLEAYARLPATEDVSVSPDGALLAYIRREDENTQVIVQARTGELIAAVDVGDGKVRAVSWASPDHVLIHSTANQAVPFYIGRELLSIVDILNIRTRHVARAMQDADVKAFNVVFSQRPIVRGNRPMLAVTGLSDNAGAFSLDLFHVDLDSGRGRRVMQGASDTRGYLVRPDGEVAARTAYNPETGRWRLSAKRGGGWSDIRNLVALLDGPNLLGFGRSLNSVALNEEVDGGYVLTEVSLTDGEQAERIPLQGDIQSSVTDRHGALVGLGYLEAYQRYQFLDPRLAEAWTTLSAALPDRQLTLASFSDDFGVVVVKVQGSGESGGYYLYDIAAKKVSLVGREYPGVTGAQLAEVRVIRFKAADGLDEMGYLTLPPGKTPTNLPLIMMPHGGPEARDEAGFDWWAQAMASRGYAVFQPNFRGSDGLGREFLEAGYGEWGKLMQSDLSDGLKVLVDRGMVDPERVCIVGASYGGYAAMAGMTLDAGTYRCGVAVAGVSDLREMLLAEQRRGARGDANPAIRYWQRFMGVENLNDPSLNARSPAKLADRLKGPLLLIHGRNDTVVPFEQSELMVRAATAARKQDVHLVPLASEDHYLSAPATRRQMLEELMRFLEEENPPA